MIRPMLIAAALVGLVACSSEHKESKSTYQFQENGCDTGSHTFEGGNQEDTRRQFCTALQDGNSNNGCAEATRQAEFEQNCPGQKWNPRASAN